jgi:hypothetical protein
MLELCMFAEGSRYQEELSAVARRARSRFRARPGAVLARTSRPRAGAAAGRQPAQPQGAAPHRHSRSIHAAGGGRPQRRDLLPAPRKAGGEVRHLGGWGFQLGDEGSAAWLGRRALSLALRVVDGRLPPDPLADDLIAATAPHPVLFAREARPGAYAQIAERVLAHAGTPLGQRLIREVIAALEEGLHDVGHTHGTPLVLTGGLGDLLTPHLPEHLTRDLTAAKGRPLDGALALARSLP